MKKTVPVRWVSDGYIVWAPEGYHVRVQVPDIRYQVRHQVAGATSGSRCAVSRRVRDVPMVMATPDTR